MWLNVSVSAAAWLLADKTLSEAAGSDLDDPEPPARWKECEKALAGSDQAWDRPLCLPPVTLAVKVLDDGQKCNLVFTVVVDSLKRSNSLILV